MMYIRRGLIFRVYPRSTSSLFAVSFILATSNDFSRVLSRSQCCHGRVPPANMLTAIEVRVLAQDDTSIVCSRKRRVNDGAPSLAGDMAVIVGFSREKTQVHLYIGTKEASRAVLANSTQEYSTRSCAVKESSRLY